MEVNHAGSELHTATGAGLLPHRTFDNSDGLCRLRLEVILVCSLAVQLFEALVFELTRNKQLCRQEMVSFTSGRVQSYFYLL